MGNIFSWFGACTAGKVGKVSSFVGKIFVVRPPTTKNHRRFVSGLYSILMKVSQ